MAILPRLQELLEEQNVPYSHTTHPLAYTAREVAQAEHLRPHEVAKTVVFLADGDYGFAVLPANCLVDLQALREALGAAHVRLATESEIAHLFPDMELGAMPPFGNLYDMPVYVDSSLADEETIAFNAGTHKDVLHLKFSDFQKLVKPVMISFSRVH